MAGERSEARFRELKRRYHILASCISWQAVLGLEGLQQAGLELRWR